MEESTRLSFGLSGTIAGILVLVAGGVLEGAAYNPDLPNLGVVGFEVSFAGSLVALVSFATIARPESGYLRTLVQVGGGVVGGLMFAVGTILQLVPNDSAEINGLFEVQLLLTGLALTALAIGAALLRPARSPVVPVSPSPGSTVPPGAAFCPYCGTSMGSEFAFCARCGRRRAVPSP